MLLELEFMMCGVFLTAALDVEWLHQSFLYVQVLATYHNRTYQSHHHTRIGFGMVHDIVLSNKWMTYKRMLKELGLILNVNIFVSSRDVCFLL